MINNVLTKVFGTHNDRELKRISEAFLGPINSLEPSMEKLSDSDLSRKTEEFKDRLANSETLDDILVDAFAVAREAGRRVLNMRHYDVQLIGGVVLHEGKIAEMATGEGKTLVATLPAYLNALAGGGVHIITVNDYLARRDSEWMGPLYELLGLTIGNIQHDMPDDDRRAAYGADITFGTNNEFGFDYLRDNMKFQSEDMVQPTHNFAIVDEVDSILIDESRTPLIISGPAEQSTELYYKVDRLIPALKLERDYEVDEKNRSAALTEEGVSHLERLLGVDNLYDASHMDLVHHVQQAVKAHALFKLDRDYLLKDGEVVIVDEFTGRMMPGRRWSDGLHQAVEAKEGVKIAQENQTLATITFQNFFRMYDKLAGMTGTAITEAPEFHKIYDLDVLEIPTNKPLIRDEMPDVIFRTESEKWKATVEEIAEQHGTGRPVLVGTTSIEKSEKISKMLGKRGVKHVVLNAKHHEREAEIVALAGQQGAVTIATNMAGRGTDIVLGDGVKELGGLHVLGTERHEARRIDNQLRGRTGRQGDAGSSQFILSLEDDLMRIFGMDRLQGLMARLGMEENVPIEDRMVTKALERAQRQVEGRNFETRKHLLEYDDVMEKQRQAIYAMRHDQMTDETAPRRFVLETAEDILDWLLDTHFDPEADPLDWETDEMRTQLKHFFGLGREDFTVDLDQDSIQDIRTELLETIRVHYQTKVDRIGEVITQFETWICLQVIDARWKEHLYALDRLKEGIGLRGYGQRNPLVEYKRESFEMYQEVHERICGEVVRYAFQLEPMSQEERQAQLAQQQAETKRVQRVAAAAGGPSSATETVVRQKKKVGRNSPCPCGSGRKYKKCCGR